MIIDAYTATITSDSVDVRIISDSPKDITVLIDPESALIINPQIHVNNLYFFKYRCNTPYMNNWKSATADNTPYLNNWKSATADNRLLSDKEYTLHMSQDQEKKHEIRFKTLAIPPGQKICRFGILTDLHIAHNYIQRPDSGKRLYGKALELAQTYITEIEKQGADFIIFPGDTLDPASKENITLFTDLKNRSSIPFYPVIGNHESWGTGDGNKFNRLFCAGENGFYAFSVGNVRFIMLSTPEQSSLYPQTAQYAWLKQELEEHGRSMNIFLFLHFSIILHPCVRGYKNDGMQQLYNSKELRELLQKYKGIKAVFAGHKNVPSKIMHHGIAHILSPQLIQAPCGYDVVDVYDHGLTKTTYEIDEQDYVWQSRMAYGRGWQERYGTEESRNFTLLF
ncbi:MAG: metallophosphoesterase [Spirochaetales bacterium]|nr:metallophosphoesterase [Spirochaetales bacterium]